MLYNITLEILLTRVL